jgi:thiamine pyrophosphate-dependent acetolactate synthase large subunit-like protein
MFDWPSFADVANALGGRGIAVRGNDDLALAEAAIVTRDRPLLIELVLDPNDVPRMRY